jgi:phosphomannomutase
MRHIFDVLTLQVTAEVEQREDWEVDTENLEGLRIRTGSKQFFMLRKSLHDPLISLQIESRSAENARQQVIEPLLEIMQASSPIQEGLDTSVLKDY